MTAKATNSKTSKKKVGELTLRLAESTNQVKSSEELRSQTAETTHISDSTLLSPKTTLFNNSLMRRSHHLMMQDNDKKEDNPV